MPVLAGETALVTGAAGGIGSAIVSAFRAEGAKVIAVDMEAPAGVVDAEFVSCDLGDRRSIAGLASKTGPISILVNCAGIVVFGDCTATSDADWDRSIEINVRAPFALSREYIPGMAAQKCGAIVNIASVCSSILALPERAAYGSSKAALIGLTLSIARDYVKQGVRCNAIAPGTIATPLLQRRLESASDRTAMMNHYLAQQPGGKLGTAQDIALAAVFLARRDNSFVTGAVLTVDGAMSI